MEPENSRSEHMRRTRYLKPIDACNFTGNEMIQGLFASLSPALIASVNQLHGDRKGVVRVTCKNMDAVNDLDTKVASRKVLINGVRLAPVTESGFFVRVTLSDVPEYISTPALERELAEYGAVVHSKRECVDYHGYRVENETRHVLFSYLTKEIPPSIRLEDQEVYVTYHRKALKPRPAQTIDEVISHPDNIPRHLINNLREHPSDGLLSRSRSGTPKPGNALTELEVPPAPDDMMSSAQSVPTTPKSSKRLPLTNSPYPTRRQIPASSVPNLHEVSQCQAQQDDGHTRAHGSLYYIEGPGAFQGPSNHQSSTEPERSQSVKHGDGSLSNVMRLSLPLTFSANAESHAAASNGGDHHHHQQQLQQQHVRSHPSASRLTTPDDQQHTSRSQSASSRLMPGEEHTVRSSSSTRLADDREMESHL